MVFDGYIKRLDRKGYKGSARELHDAQAQRRPLRADESSVQARSQIELRCKDKPSVIH